MAAVPGTAAFAVANEVAGAEVTRATTVTESPLAVPAGKVKVTGTAVVTPTRKLVAAPNEMADGVRGEFADAGATDVRTPRPKAATATSAIRLNVVDICFLSKVDLRNFRRSAWKKLLSSTRFIARADESNSPPCIRTR